MVIPSWRKFLSPYLSLSLIHIHSLIGRVLCKNKYDTKLVLIEKMSFVLSGSQNQQTLHEQDEGERVFQDLR